MYFRNNIKKENKNINKLNNSININKDPKQPTIIESFNKAKEKALVSDNEMEICIHNDVSKRMHNLQKRRLLYKQQVYKNSI